MQSKQIIYLYKVISRTTNKSSVPKKHVSHKKSLKVVCLVALYPNIRFLFNQVEHVYGTEMFFWGHPIQMKEQRTNRPADSQRAGIGLLLTNRRTDRQYKPDQGILCLEPEMLSIGCPKIMFHCHKKFLKSSLPCCIQSLIFFTSGTFIWDTRYRVTSP